jgi:RES domain
VVDIHLPPPRVTVTPTVFTLLSGQCIVRIFAPSRWNTTALTFRSFGPLARFDHHRSTLQNPQPSDDPERSIYYAGFTLSCCIVEVFGDQRLIDVQDYRVASVQVVRDLKLLDLRGASAMLNGSVAGLSCVPDRKLTQEWSRYFYEQTTIYGWVDGLIYLNAHNSEDAIALYERASDGLSCLPADIMPLNHRLLRAEIRQIAQKNGLIVTAY